MRGIFGGIDAGAQIRDPHAQLTNLGNLVVELGGQAPDRTITGRELGELRREPIPIGTGVDQLLLGGREPDHLVLGAVPGVLGGALQAALRERSRRLGPVELGAQVGAGALLVAQPRDVLVEQTVVFRQRAPQHRDLVQGTFVLVLEMLQLVGDLGARRALGAGPLLGLTPRLLGGQALELAAQRRRLVLGVGAGAQLLFEPLVLVGQHPARFLGRPVVPARRVLELGETLANRAPTGVDRRGNGHRVDGERRRRGRRQLGAFSLRE